MACFGRWCVDWRGRRDAPAFERANRRHLRNHWGLLQRNPGPVGWRIAFILGLMAAPLLWVLMSAMPAIEMEAGYGVLVTAGLVVGFGTRLGSGCTSGHGVCGLSRLSMRSLAATLVFMAAGFVTVHMLCHGITA